MKRIVLALALLASPVLAQEKAKIPQPQYVLRCGPPIPSNTSHEKLAMQFGAKNVTVEKMDRGDGNFVGRTVLFANDPTRRVEIEWLDEGGKTCPVNVNVSGEKNRWTGPFGVRTGMTIRQFERINGAPFKVHDFGSKTAVFANFRDGKLHRPTPRCAVSATFELAESPPAEFLKRLAADEIDSKDPELLLLKPKVQSYSISYPPEC
jgi:hypothetical protein